MGGDLRSPLNIKNIINKIIIKKYNIKNFY